MKETNVSVIVPVLNVEKYLRECIDSILMQEDVTYEIICVDDGSVDSSSEILREYAEEGKITFLMHDINRGQAAARNTGLEHSTGEYVVFVDSDDYIEKKALAKIYQVAKQNKADIVSFNYDTFDDITRIIEDRKWEYYEGVWDGFDIMKAQISKKEVKGAVCQQMISLKFLKDNKLSFKEGILHEDSLFYFHCMVKAKRVCDIKENLYHYRQREKSTMMTYNKTRTESMFLIISDLLQNWNRGNYTEEQGKVIGDYIKIMVSAYRKMQGYCDVEQLSMGTDAERFAFSLLRSSIYRHVKLEERHYEEIGKYDEVVVYGAGIVASEVLKQLDNRVVVSKILVNNTMANPQKYFGIPVEDYRSTMINRKKCLVIIAVGERQCKKILHDLREEKYNNILELDYLK